MQTIRFHTCQVKRQPGSCSARKVLTIAVPRSQRIKRLEKSITWRMQATEDEVPSSKSDAVEPAAEASASGAGDEQAEADSGSGGSDAELDVVEKLRLAVLDGNLDDAAVYTDAVVAEVAGLASIVEAKEEVLKSTLATTEQLKDQYRRLQADFDNFRNRAVHVELTDAVTCLTLRSAAQNLEKQQAGANAKMSMIEDLLPLIDGFELAASQVKTETPGEEKINNNYQAMYKKMVDVFRGMGLEAVPTEGHPFDPEIHDGIMREETTEVANGIILQEFRKGFTFKGKLLRPAMVKVAVSDEEPASDKPASAESESESVPSTESAV